MNTVGELLERNARHYPDLDAYVIESQRVTWRQYMERVRRVSSAIRRAGLRRQDRIGILSNNTMEFAELFGACEWAGFILALYNFRLAAPEVAWLLEDSAPSLLFFEAQFVDAVDANRARVASINRYVCIGAPVPDWAQSYEQFVSDGGPSDAVPRSRASDLVYLFYTSGTTGRPKGVAYSHRGALFTARTQGRQCGPDLRVLQVTPMFHIGGKGFPLAAAWMAGTTVMARKFDALEFLEILQRERITFTFMVAPMILAVLDHPRFHEFNLSSLRSVMSASAPIPVPLLKRAMQQMGQVFFVSYGSTEGGGICTLERHELKPEGTEREVGRLGSVGHFNPEIDAVILDADDNPCPPGIVGEVCLHSGVFEGYWNNTIATLEATRSGWLHTGDLGYQDEEGFVFLVDRKKDMIISGGENIYSREVEEALHRHPAVQEAAVIGVPDERWGEAVRAHVVLRMGYVLSGADLLGFCQTQIARYKCPKIIEFSADLPRLASGKIDKVSLRRMYGGGRLPSIAREPGEAR